MSRPVKIALYVVCITLSVVFGLKAKQEFSKASRAKQSRQQQLDDAAGIESTNVLAETNAVTLDTNALRPTNIAPNSRAVEGAATDTNAAGALPVTPASPRAARPAASYSRMITYLLLCGLGFVGFAFLLARDVTHLVAHKAEQALFNDDGAPEDPEYEQAEELWKDGKYLESIQAMREYLQKHPREQYVALRIAEIYEGNLHNPVAAALEYEEVLNKKLPPERWGWAAIHLANLYSGPLNQPDKSIALLRRIDAEYGQTSAANKARERLIQIDPDFVPASTVTAVDAQSPPDDAPPSNLPPGFRPKTKA
jgi:TolA-binding protein